MRVFKVCPAEEWKEAERSGVYSGTKMDRGYGYIHLCTEEQIPSMIARFNADKDRLVLVEINSDKVQRNLRYEMTRAGGVFPHLYDSLTMEAVVKTSVIERRPDGTFSFHERAGGSAPS